MLSLKDKAEGVYHCKLQLTKDKDYVSVVYIIIAVVHMPMMKSYQGQRKLFITGQAKLNPEQYSIKCIGGQYFHHC